MINDRPHPGPLPQESEQTSPPADETTASINAPRQSSDIPVAATTTERQEIVTSVPLPSLSPEACRDPRVGGRLAQSQRDCILSFRRTRLVMQPFQGCVLFLRATQGGSPTRNPGQRNGIPLGFTGSRAGLVAKDKARKRGLG